MFSMTVYLATRVAMSANATKMASFWMMTALDLFSNRFYQGRQLLAMNQGFRVSGHTLRAVDKHTHTKAPTLSPMVLRTTFKTSIIWLRDPRTEFEAIFADDLSGEITCSNTSRKNSTST
jgi:hypothetical protein